MPPECPPRVEHGAGGRPSGVFRPRRYGQASGPITACKPVAQFSGTLPPLRGPNQPLHAVFAADDMLIEVNTTEQLMPKAHIRNDELTIPLSDEIREKLNAREGEELQAHVLEDGLIVTRTSPEARRRAGERLFEIIDRVRLRPGQKP
jgi:hypothetical protein